MSKLEWAEVAVILLVVPGIWFASPELDWTLSLGRAVCYGAALLLGQGLIRDIARLAGRRKAAGEKVQRLRCLCAESTVGLVAIVIGALLLLGGIEATVTFTQGKLTATLAVVLVAGFVMKNYAVTIRRIEDHDSVIVG